VPFDVLVAPWLGVESARVGLGEVGLAS